MADQMLWYKYIIKNVAKRHGKTVTFMPKPIFGDNGSGMHTHMSLLEGRQAADGRRRLCGPVSELALHAIGGILKHGRSLLAFSAPTVNSYHRLVPGYEAPVDARHEPAEPLGRLPHSDVLDRARRRSGSSSAARIRPATPYLSFTALMMAMLDGIQNKIDPGEPLDRDIYEMSREELRARRTSPASRSTEALEALEGDHAYLLKGDVFTEDVIENWIKCKQENEIDPVRLRPHPYEFDLYYNC